MFIGRPTTVHHGGVVMSIPESDPKRFDNFNQSTITPPENGTPIKPPSFIPVLFGVGFAMLFIAYNKTSNASFSFNFR